MSFTDDYFNLLIPGVGPYRLGKRVRDFMDTNKEIREAKLKEIRK